MKNTLRAAAIGLAMCVTPTTMTGCGVFPNIANQSPEQKFVNVQEAYIAVVATLIQARRSGVIDRETWADEVNPLIQRGNEARLAYEAAIEMGEDPSLYRVILQETLHLLELIDTTAPTDVLNTTPDEESI